MFMGFGLIIPILLIVGVVYWLNNREQGVNSPFSSLANNDKSALAIAQERYARGEIDKDEYEQLHHDLSN